MHSRSVCCARVTVLWAAVIFRADSGAEPGLNGLTEAISNCWARSGEAARQIRAKPRFTQLSYRGDGLPPVRDGLDAPHRFFEILKRVGVAEADVAFAVFAEAAAIQAGDAGFVQQYVRDFLRRHAGALNVGESVERAAGDRAVEAGDLVEALTDGVAASVELGDHRLDAVLRTGDGSNAGALGEAR